MIKPNYLAILNKDKNLFKESSSNNMVGKLFKEAEDEELDLGEEGATGDGGASDDQGLDFGDSKTLTSLFIAVASGIFSFILSIGLHPYIELMVTDDSVIVLNDLSKLLQHQVAHLL